MSKTEALRHLLRDATKQRKRTQNKEEFERVAHHIIEKNRPLKFRPITKEEIDNIFEDGR